MKNSLKLVVILLSVVLVFVLTFIAVKLITGKATDIYTVNWDGFQKEIYFGSLRVKEYNEGGRYGAYFEPKSEGDVLELVQDSKDYIGEASYNMYGADYSGYTFFKDNTYYFLYKVNKGYCLSPLYTEYEEINVNYVNFPSMGNAVIIGDTESAAYRELYGELVMPNKMLFFDASFEDAAIFYERFEDYYATVDYDNNTIHIRGYDENSNTGSCYSATKCITLNFNDSVLEVYDEETEVTKAVS